TFRAAHWFPAGNGLQSVVVADLNGDGKQDIVTANFAWNRIGHAGSVLIESDVRVLLGKGDGTFQAVHVYDTGGYPLAVVAADVNGDGILDLVVANGGGIFSHGNTVGVLLGKGDGTFQAAQTYTVGSDPFALAVGDFNGDGHPDLAVAD